MNTLFPLLEQYVWDNCLFGRFNGIEWEGCVEMLPVVFSGHLVE